MSVENLKTMELEEFSSSSENEDDAGFQMFSSTKRAKLVVDTTDRDEKIEKSVKDPVHERIVFTKSEDFDAEEVNFTELGISQSQSLLLKSMSIKNPTPVQQKCIPEILKGKNILACSETGSGKTAAFVLPIIEKILSEPYGIFAVIMTPTRELAVQINDQIKVFGSNSNISSVLCIGGESSNRQSIELEKRPNFLVSTPGRLLAHLNAPNPPFLKRLRFLVLDEADRMISEEFQEIVMEIMSKIDDQQQKWTKDRQLLLFSATVKTNLETLRRFLKHGDAKQKDVFEFQLFDQESTAQTLDERYLLCPSHVKMCYFVYLLKMFGPKDLVQESVLKESKLTKKRKRPKTLFVVEERPIVFHRDAEIEDDAQRANQMIVFTSTKAMCDLLLEVLIQLEFDKKSLVSLHAGLDQPRRTAALGKFKAGLAKVMITTDVCARGLDIPKVDLVINYDLPRKVEYYIHRAGRTARAKRQGRVISLFNQIDVKKNKPEQIEKATGKRMKKLKQFEEDKALTFLTTITKAFVKAQSEIELRKIED